MTTQTAEGSGNSTCNKCLAQAGFRPIKAWPPCFYHEKLKLVLSVYVDDFKLAGPKDNLINGISNTTTTILGMHSPEV